LYIGVTNDLRVRIRQHRSGEFGGFSSEYKINRLVYYERHAWIQDAIAREKQLKRWRREKKVWLIEREIPTWEDLSSGLGEAGQADGTKSFHHGQTAGPSTRAEALGQDDTLKWFGALSATPAVSVVANWHWANSHYVRIHPP